MVADWLREFNVNSSEEFTLKKKDIESIFRQATKNDARTDRSLCRGELFDFILRIAIEKYKRATFIQKKNAMIIQKTKIGKPKGMN